MPVALLQTARCDFDLHYPPLSIVLTLKCTTRARCTGSEIPPSLQFKLLSEELPLRSA